MGSLSDQYRIMRMFSIQRTAFLLAILFWVATLAMAAVELLGRTRLPAWLFVTQWWVIAGWAWALTVYLLWTLPANLHNPRGARAAPRGDEEAGGNGCC